MTHREIYHKIGKIFCALMQTRLNYLHSWRISYHMWQPTIRFPPQTEWRFCSRHAPCDHEETDMKMICAW